MAERVIVAGVGMTAFVAPSRSAPYPVLVAEAVCEALADAGLEFGDIGRAYAGYVYGDSTSGQRALYGLGMTGIPVFNVNNNCASGSTALMRAREAVLSGVHECVLALGFEQMPSGAITEKYADRPGPLEPFAEAARRNHGESDAPLALRLFGGAARDYASRHGMSPEGFASIAVKSRRHAAANPRAVFRAPLTIEDVLASPMLFDPLTRLQCCPPTCGAGAAVLVSDTFARRRGIPRGVTIAAQAMATDAGNSLDGDMVSVVGDGMSRAAARAVYSEAGIGPNDCQVIELHDCFTSNEVVSYEALELVPPGDAGRMIFDGDNTYGGRYVVNPSGGLLSKGHPLGATGLAQCYELVNQLRGRCGTRQVEGARMALQHNIGLGGACVVALYQKLDGV